MQFASFVEQVLISCMQRRIYEGGGQSVCSKQGPYSPPEEFEEKKKEKMEEKEMNRKFAKMLLIFSIQAFI